MLARMARRSRSPRRGAAPTTPVEPVAPAAPALPAVSGTRTAARRDRRRWIYAGLDLGFAALYAVALATVAASRHATDRALLWALPVLAASAGGGLIAGGRRGWRVAVGACAGLCAIAAWLLLAIAVDAAFLAGVYGPLGASVVSFALIAGLVIIELVALVPALQLAWLRGPAGRRAFGVPRPSRKARA
jgi:hypothetical protein